VPRSRRRTLAVTHLTSSASITGARPFSAVTRTVSLPFPSNVTVRLAEPESVLTDTLTTDWVTLDDVELELTEMWEIAVELELTEVEVEEEEVPESRAAGTSFAVCAVSSIGCGIEAGAAAPHADAANTNRTQSTAGRIPTNSSPVCGSSGPPKAVKCPLAGQDKSLTTNRPGYQRCDAPSRRSNWL
jgi:hypothetical protein